VTRSSLIRTNFDIGVINFVNEDLQN